MNNPGFKRGLYFGASTIVVFLLVYLVSKKALFIPGLWPLTGIIFPIVFMVLAARDTRSMQDGFMSFGEALSSTFLTFVIGSLIYTLFRYVMMNLVDSSLLEYGKEVALEALDSYSEILGEEQVDVFKDQLEEGGAESGLGSHLMQWALLLIVPGFLYSAIISAITKRNYTP